MSKDNQHINQLLQQWISGEARREEAGQLEQLAVKDPFLADALEGYEQFPASDHSEKMDQLRSRMSGTPNHQGRLIPTSYYIRRIAAGLAILAVASVAFWFIGNHQGPASEQAMEKESSEAAALADQEQGPSLQSENLATSDTVISQPAAPSLTPGPQTSPPIASREESQARQNRSLLNPDGSATDDLGVDEGRVPAREGESSGIINSLPSPVPPSISSSSRTEEDYSFDQSNAVYISPTQRIIGGIVTDETGQPLIGADVLVPGTNVGTVTGVDGSFQLVVDKNARNLSVSYTGYANRQVALDGKSKLDIALAVNERTQLGEVAVSEYARAKKDLTQTTTTDAATPAVVAEPKGGFRRLERHIRKNQQLPPDLPENGGTVKVQFQINPDGALSNLKVIRSNCATCNAEAIRLLREGPEWTLENSSEPVIREYEVKLEKE